MPIGKVAPGERGGKEGIVGGGYLGQSGRVGWTKFQRYFNDISTTFQRQQKFNDVSTTFRRHFNDISTTTKNKLFNMIFHGFVNEGA